MRAAVMRNDQLVVDEIDSPTPGPGEVLVKTLACGICGSDLHALKHGHQMVSMSAKMGGPFTMDLSRDVVMGHEFCAEILDYGPSTQGTLKPGTRVCSMPVLARADGMHSIGYSNNVNGGYSEQMLLTEPLLLEVPNGLSTELAALTEPMAVGYHAVEKANITGREVPLVIGCGPVGLAVISALKLKGIGPVIAADFSPTRRQLAERLGADIIVDPAASSPYASWVEAATGLSKSETSVPNPLTGENALRPAVYFECVGVPGIIDQMMIGAPRDCRIVIVGVCMEQDQMQPFFGITRELNLQFVLGYTPDEFSRTLQLIAEGKIDGSPLITGQIGISGVPQAFEDLGDPEQHAKILVEPWRDQ